MINMKKDKYVDKKLLEHIEKTHARTHGSHENWLKSNNLQFI